MSENDKYSEESTSLSEKQIKNSVKYLKSAFRGACVAYRESHPNAKVSTFVFRDKRTQQPQWAEDEDYTLYHAQIEFSYIIDDIERGPRCFAALEIKRCNDLIDSLAA